MDESLSSDSVEDPPFKLPTLRQECVAVEAEIRDSVDSSPHLDRVESWMRDYMQGAFGSEDAMRFFLRSGLPKFLVTQMKRGDQGDMGLRANKFFQRVLDFCLWLLDEEDSIEALEVIAKIFNPRSFSIYKEDKQIHPDYLGEEKVEEETEGVFAYKPPSEWDISPLYVANLNYFGRIRGFDKLLSRIAKSPKCSLLMIRSILKLIYRCKEFLVPRLLKEYTVYAKNVIQEHLIGLTDEEMKNEDRRSVPDIISTLRELLQACTNVSVEELKDTEIFGLEIALKCLKNKISLETRLNGLSEIKEKIASVARKEQYLRNYSAYHSEEVYPSSADIDPAALTTDYLLDWLRKKGVIEEIFGENMHPQIVQRSSELIKFLASEGQLTIGDIDFIWDATKGKYEAVTHALFAVINDFFSFLPTDQMEYLFSKIKEIPFEEYDMQTLFLVQHTTGTLLRPLYEDNVDTTNQELFGLDLMWQLTQDDAPVSVDIASQAMMYLVDFLIYLASSHRPYYMEKCIENLRNGTSVPQSLRILHRIIGLYPIKTSRPEEESLVQTAVVEYLENKHDLLDTLFKDLVRYRQRMAEKIQLENVDESNVVHLRYGKFFNHLMEIHNRLELLTFMTSTSSLTLRKEEAEIFWDNLIANPLCREERESALQWLIQINLDTVFDQEVSAWLFTTRICSMDFENISPLGFQTFEYFFRYLNWKNGSVALDSKNSITAVPGKEIVGMETLWKISLSAVDTQVGKDSVTLLNKLQLYGDEFYEESKRFLQDCMTMLGDAERNFSSQTKGKASAKRAVERCLEIVKSYLEGFETAVGATTRHGSSSKGAPVHITVAVLQGPKFAIDTHTNATIGRIRRMLLQNLPEFTYGIRLIYGGKELKDDSKRLCDYKISEKAYFHGTRRGKDKEGENSHNSLEKKLEKHDFTTPAQMLSTETFFSKVFDLLNFEEDIAERAWELLMMIPTNPYRKSQILDFSLVDGGNWEAVFDTTNPYHLLYTLQIAEQIVLSIDDSVNSSYQRQEWEEKFKDLGGLQFLVQVYMNGDFFEGSYLPRRKHSLALLVKLLNYFLLDGDSPVEQDTITLIEDKRNPKKEQERADQPEKSASSQKHIPILSEPFSRIISVPLLLEKLMDDIAHLSSISFDNFEEQDSEVFRQLTKLFVGCALHSADGLALIYKHRDIDNWFYTTLLECEVEQARKVIADALSTIFLNFPEMHGDASFEIHPFMMLSATLLDFLKNMGTSLNMNHSEQFFDLLCSFFHKSCITGCLNVDRPQLLKLLVSLIKEHPVRESRSFPEYKKEAGFENVGGLIDHIFYDSLFNIPSEDNHGPYAPPKCKSKESRLAAFSLLEELAAGCVENFRELEGLLLKQHIVDEPRQQWHYHPELLEKSDTGYVGLKNLGCTCYMNALMQQFYMIPKFRHGILGIDIDYVFKNMPKEENFQPNETVLFQLQLLLGHLQESEKRYYDPRPFTLCYKDYDGRPMNPTQQMDVDEFFSTLFDKLDNTLEKTSYNKLLASFFGGEMTSQVISQDKEHPYVSERDESFYSIGLIVKNKKNVTESLNLMIEGELLDGNNKYYCEKYDMKVDAVKRNCIKSLPNHLVLHLKRFDFDLDIMKKMKINDLYEFPATLNLEPYTREGRYRREKEEGTGIVDVDESLEEALRRPQSYYEYELKGILVHTGTADSGHYYAYIKERASLDGSQELKWFHFNDTSVEPFNPAEIPSACFGGLEPSVQWESTKSGNPRMLTKNYSAYLLFYDRVKVEPMDESYLPEIVRNAYNGMDLVERAANLVPRNIFGSIWEDNMKFLMDKNIFDPSYFEFLWNIVHIENEPPVHSLSFPGGYHPTSQNVELATTFVVETLSHAKEKQSFGNWIDFLKKLYKRFSPACATLLKSLIKDQQYVRQMLFECTVPTVRRGFAELLCEILNVVMSYEEDLLDSFEEVSHISAPVEDVDEFALLAREMDEPKALSLKFMDSYIELLEDAPYYWRHFAEYFYLFERFSLQGTKQRKYLLRRQIVSRFVHFYLQDESPHASVEDPLTGRRKRVKMGDKISSPVLKYMVSTISTLVRCCETEVARQKGHPPSQLNCEAFEMSDLDKEMLFCHSFFPKIIKENINVEATAEIVCHVCWENRDLSFQVIEVIAEGINIVDYEQFPPYFGVLTPLLEIRDSFHVTRAHFAMQQLFRVIQDNTNYKNATLHAVKYLVRVAETIPAVNEYIFDKMFIWVEPLLMEHFSEFVRDEAVSLIKCLIPGCHVASPPTSPAGGAYMSIDSPSPTDGYMPVGPLGPVLGPMPQGAADSHPNSANASPTGDRSSNVYTRVSPFAAYEPPIEEPPENLSEEGEAKLKTVYKNLLSLLKSAMRHTRGSKMTGVKGSSEDPAYNPNSWKLTQYFRLLMFCMRGNEQLEEFGKHMGDVVDLFFLMDKQRSECDENKRWATLLLEKAFQYQPNCEKFLKKTEKFPMQVMDFFISIKPNERFLTYNQMAIPAFYRVILRLCKESPEFLEGVSKHKNFDWATTYMIVENSEYSAIVEPLLKVVEIASPVNKEYRIKFIQTAFTDSKIMKNELNCLKLVNILLQSTEDYECFFESRGLEILSQIIEQRHVHDADVDSLEILRATLNMLVIVLSWLAEKQESEDFGLRRLAEEEFRCWDAKLGVMSTLLQFLGTCPPDFVRNPAYAVLAILCDVDLTCCHNTLECIYNEHCEYAKNPSSFSDNEVDSRYDPYFEEELGIENAGICPLRHGKHVRRILTGDLSTPLREKEERFYFPYYTMVTRVISSALKSLSQIVQYMSMCSELALYMLHETLDLEKTHLHVLNLLSSLLTEEAFCENFYKNDKLTLYVTDALQRRIELLSCSSFAKILSAVLIRERTKKGIISTIYEGEVTVKFIEIVNKLEEENDEEMINDLLTGTLEILPFFPFLAETSEGKDLVNETVGSALRNLKSTVERRHINTSESIQTLAETVKGVVDGVLSYLE